MAGLLAAKELGLKTGGCAPRDYNTEEGPNLELKTLYGLVAKGSYYQRTYNNVRDSDATVIFGKLASSGSRLTSRYCTVWKKPFITNPNMGDLLAFLEEHRIETLNVAGNRETKNPGIEQRVRAFLVEALSC